ncbi:MAG TPA: dockerin type I repeat-containing protein [Planctomycetota bacterium]|nr:dockerin type I repeat-containing protein [Planctomycetota bacterium]OQC19285.1 MAG: hypothetical protein BWX69_02855 [Planctomycetes bacterium ADurb.Bin069]NMD36523.1 hypothetical protein [Planctomycetota bacterium]HNS00210.1 dockerin type I repeat-containing protein [Planctomycetota bacterium]HNU26847.1 dockerin type I repeat-containing protein [Planctomycetota bacterium]
MRRLVSSLIAAGAFAGLAAGAAGDITNYELLTGSLLRDECLYCDRVPIVRPIRGTFALEAGEDICGSVNYRVLALEFASESNDYTVEGEGLWRYLVLADPLQEMELDIAVNGARKTHVVSGLVPMVQPPPLIRITVRDEDPRDPNHIYILEIFAAPAPVAWQTYRLAKESELIDDCPICNHVTVPVPITGTFLLGELPGGAGLDREYVVDKIAFESADVTRPYTVRGGGLYRRGSDAAKTQSMALVVSVNTTAGIPLDSGFVPAPEPFPAIDITAKHVDPPDPLHVYSLRILAKPGMPPEVLFRRGDTNADGKLDVADAIALLAYFFSHGTAPSCLDAADANDDGKLDISDAVKTLGHLFGGAGPLPEPFKECGLDPSGAKLGCERFRPCE